MDSGTYLYIFGLLFVLYGLMKVLLVFSITLLIPKDTQAQLAKTPVVNLLITGDTTVAGKGGEVVLGVFGMFSILHGLALMGYMPGNVTRVLESKWFQYIVYTMFGIALIIFYTLVLYTDLPISKKDPENRKLYWIYGYVGGAGFLVIPVLWELWLRMSPYMASMSTRKQLAYMTAVFIVFVFIAYTATLVIPDVV